MYYTCRTIVGKTRWAVAVGLLGFSPACPEKVGSVSILLGSVSILLRIPAHEFKVNVVYCNFEP